MILKRTDMFIVVAIGLLCSIILVAMQKYKNNSAEGFSDSGSGSGSGSSSSSGSSAGGANSIPTEMVLINMDSRQDRLNNFLHYYNQSDCKFALPLHRISAVVGKTIDWTKGDLVSASAKEDLEQVARTGKRKGHSSLSVGAIGCYLSHLKALEYVVEKNTPMVICEDDLVLPADFVERLKIGLKMPTSTQLPTLILFHVLCNGWEKLRCIPKGNNFYEIHQFWSTACYYVTPETAKVILANAKPLSVQIDAMLSSLTQANKIKIYAYPITNTNIAFGTDIQVPISHTQ